MFCHSWPTPILKKHEKRLVSGEYEPGTWVLVHETWLDRQLGNKGALRWAGPYVIHSRHHNNNYHLRELDGSLIKEAVPAPRLKIFYYREDRQTMFTELSPIPEYFAEFLFEFTPIFTGMTYDNKWNQATFADMSKSTDFETFLQVQTRFDHQLVYWYRKVAFDRYAHMRSPDWSPVENFGSNFGPAHYDIMHLQCDLIQYLSLAVKNAPHWWNRTLHSEEISRTKLKVCPSVVGIRDPWHTRSYVSFYFSFSLIFAFPHPQNPYPVPAKYKSRKYFRKFKLCLFISLFFFSYFVSFIYCYSCTHGDDEVAEEFRSSRRRRLTWGEVYQSSGVDLVFFEGTSCRAESLLEPRDKSTASDSFETMEQSSPHFTFHYMFSCRTFHFERGFRLIRQFFLFRYLSFKLRTVFDTFSFCYPITVAGSSAKSTAWRGSFHV